MSFSVVPISSSSASVEIGKTLDFNNAPEFKAVTRAQLDAGIRNFILDFTGTDILDSTGLGSIFSLYRQLSRSSGNILFASVSTSVNVVVQLTRTYKVFRQFPTVNAAREAIGENQL